MSTLLPVSNVSRRGFLKLGGAAALFAGWQASSSKARAASFPTAATDPVYHFLNRISWNVRPEELVHAKQVGIAAYLEEQLAPDTLFRGKKVSYPSILDLDRTRLQRIKKNAGETCRIALITGMIARAVGSPAQLLERMVEFWADHFNVASDGLETDVVDYQRTAIRRNALTNFHDLLVATAKHPAMLYYLDNASSVAAHPNQNYARELMELHTLGVNNGYVEADVNEVARAFTGWTVDDSQPGGFRFDAANHDTDPKTVMGTALPGGRGIEDGMDVLNLLASHPNTAKFVCGKLCVRFISDTPPQSIVNTLATVWSQNNGDIRAVLRALFQSAEFAQAVGQKLRRPLDFVIGSLRATTTTFTNFNFLNDLLDHLDQVPYNWHPPNGYPDVAGKWANSNGLLLRWNFSQTITETALNSNNSGMRTGLLKRIGKPLTVGQLVDNLATALFGLTLDSDVRDQLIAFVTPNGANTALTKTLLTQKLGSLAGLMLSAPMFQWR